MKLYTKMGNTYIEISDLSVLNLNDYEEVLGLIDCLKQLQKEENNEN